MNVELPTGAGATMTDFRAVALAEGFEDGTEEEQIEAWQHLIDTGLAWRLQGAFGRQAARMIDAGICRAKEQTD